MSESPPAGFAVGKDALALEFAAAMARLGPFCAKPLLGVGVSGGADSTALALLAQHWAVERGGAVIALIVDHGLRPHSAGEASLTRQRLEARGIAARVITLTGLGGSKLQERARIARHAALIAAARQAGALYVLLGHHAADQSETVAMRALRSENGLEGMAAWTARNDAVILRPLLTMAPLRLRDYLRLENMAWVEDPSNQDRRFERVRMRLAGSAVAPQSPAARQQREIEAAEFLARHVILRPEGFAVILAQSAPPASLAALLRIIGGARYAPRQDAVRRLAARLRPATLGGVRLLEAGKLAGSGPAGSGPAGSGWLLVREPKSCAGPIPVRQGAVWDGRFRILEESGAGECGALGTETAMFRNASNLPAAVLAGLPCVREPGNPAAKPRLAKAIFIPPAPAAALWFQAPAAGSFSG